MLSYILGGVTIALILLLASCATEPPDPVSDPPVNLYIEQGRTLAKGLAACGFCHGDNNSPDAILSGGQIQFDTYGEITAPNLTTEESALGNWSTLDIMKLFRTAQRPDETLISTDLHAGYEWISDDDLLAIIAYLKSLPAIKNDLPRRTISMIDRNTTGFFKSIKSVTGFVPDIDKSYQLEYGQYLVDHVARCGVCHNTKASVLNDERYLGGGEVVKNSKGEKVAPNITQSEAAGIGSWSEEEIVEYLQTGVTPGGREVEADFCPVEFYKNALPQDIISIARYLKSVPALN